ncbi:hypothetical protein ACJMK2_038227, partial [Sinanodonta woodiana]
VPHVIILTKVDNVCPLVMDDLSTIFDSAEMSSLVYEVSSLFGLPRANVLPFRNVEDQLEADYMVDLLALFNMRQILRFATGFIDTQSMLTKREDTSGM